MLKLNIVSCFKLHKLLLLNLIFTIVFAVVSLNFSLCQFKESQRQQALNENLTEYKILLNNKTSSKKIIDFFDDYDNDVEVGYVVISNADTSLLAYSKGAYDISHGEPLKNNNDIVIGSDTISNNVRIGDTVHILGKDFTVSGMRVGGKYDEVLIDGVSDTMVISEIVVKFKSIPSSLFIKNFNNYISDNFPDCSVEFPNNNKNITGNTYYFRASIVVLLIAIANITFVISYLLNKRKQTINVMHICGASIKKTTMLTVTELLIYFLISTVIGNILFYTVFYKFLSIEYKFSIYDLMFSYIIFFTLFLIIFILFQQKFIKSLKKATVLYYE